jgi:CheY-like chemotaxis protein
MHLLCSLATLITRLRLRVSYASERGQFSKARTRGRISQTMPLTILFAEDHETVRAAVVETLELEGWWVEACADGRAALARLEGGERFDVLLFDNELPGVGGLELARRARATARHGRTPIILISASDLRAEARGAGADLFLRKPQDVGLLVETIKGLVERGREG